MFSKSLIEEPCSPGVVRHNNTTNYFGNLDDKFDSEQVPYFMEYSPKDNSINVHDVSDCNVNENDDENLKNTPHSVPETKKWHNQPLEIQFSHIHNTTTRANVMLFIKQLMDVKANLSIGIIGKNKIQLMKLIIRVLIENQTKIGLFTESVVNGLNLRQSPIEYLSNRFKNDLNLLNIQPVDRAKYIRRKLRRVSLKGKLVYKRMKYLTPTQLYRVALCISIWNEPHFLIMNGGVVNQFSLDVIDRFHGHIFFVASDRYQHLLEQRIDEYWSSN